MLAIGVAVGAAVGPAPSASFAGPSGLPLPLLLRTLRLGAQPAAAPSAAAVRPPATATTTTTPAQRRRRRIVTVAPGGEDAAPSETAAPSTPTGTSTVPGPPETAQLAPASHVWLIELSGSGFGEAVAQPAAASYIDTQAIPQGTLLSGWSALDANTFASDAAQLAGSPPQLLDTIVQPPCPADGEGASGASSPQGEATAAQCAPGSPAGLAAASAFLEQTLPTITSTAPYRENGLVVVTFATVAAGAASGLPDGTTSATLPASSPAGALLISNFSSAGARSSVPFSAASPQHSLEQLLRAKSQLRKPRP